MKIKRTIDGWELKMGQYVYIRKTIDGWELETGRCVFWGKNILYLLLSFIIKKEDD